MIKFITGNKGKLEEARQILGEVEALDIDLEEIQEIDPQKIIEAKLLEAQKHHQGEYIIEDTSLYLDGLNGLPGPLIKWFLKTVGNEGLYRLSGEFGNDSVAKTIIGYTNERGAFKFFTGEITGKIVEPKGTGFGWDPVFKPNGSNKTFGEMNPDEKNAISMRKLALEKLQEYLNDQKS